MRHAGMKGRMLTARRRSAGCDRRRDVSLATNSGKLGESLGEAGSVAPDEAPNVNVSLVNCLISDLLHCKPTSPKHIGW